MQLTPDQVKFFKLNCSFPAMFAGMGSGKSQTLLIRALIDKFFIAPDGDLAIYNPTHELARLNLVPRFIELLEGMPVEFDYNKVNNILTINNYGQILFRTMDAPSRIIAYEVWRSYVDELDTLPQAKAEEVWYKILGRNRQVVKSGAANRIYTFSTPEGFRFCYNQWYLGKNKKDYQFTIAKTKDNPHLPRSYIADMQSTYPNALLAAYLNGEFVNLSANTVYYAFNRKNHRKKIEKPNKTERLLIGMDFNVGNMSAVIYVKREQTFYAIDEFYGLLDTPDMIHAIRTKYPVNPLLAYPDASGSARKTVDASKSDIILLKQNGFRVKAKMKNPYVKDRVAAANLAFQNGTVKIDIKKCPEYVLGLEQLPYDKHGNPDKNSGKDHITDAGTYMIAFELPIKVKLKRLVSQRTWK